ncbi:MAG TPA: Gfo/Idh/MocA family oxidoreductase [Tepidisphaeraceae bacterium]
MAKVKLAILGCGGMAGAHAHQFKANPDVEIVALCDVDDACTARFIERNLKDYKPAPKTYTDPAKMYSAAKPDAVVIVTPHTLHFEHGMQAIAAGCHVLMEKPMVTDSTQAKTLAEAVKKSGKILTIGYNSACSPEFAFIRDAIRKNRLGKLEIVTGFLSQNWKKMTAGSWRQDPKLSGGGQMYDSGAHLFNSLVWSVEQPIAQVFAFTDNVGTPVDINGTVNIKFTSGTLATIAISGNSNSNGSHLAFIFENGLIEADGWGGSWLKLVENGQAVKYPQITDKAQTPMSNFVDAILGRTEPKTSPQNGIYQSQLMDAIYESAKTGKVAAPKNT